MSRTKRILKRKEIQREGNNYDTEPNDKPVSRKSRSLLPLNPRNRGAAGSAGADKQHALGHVGSVSPASSGGALVRQREVIEGCGFGTSLPPSAYIGP